MGKFRLFLFLLLLPFSAFSIDSLTVGIFNTKVYTFVDSADYEDYSNAHLLNKEICETSIEDGLIYMYIPDSTCVDHEIIHATWFILEYFGVKINAYNNEIQAYLFEEIKRKILKKE